MSFNKINKKAEDLADSITHGLNIENISTGYLIDWLNSSFNYDLDIKYIELQPSISGLVYSNYGEKDKFLIHINNTECVSRQKFTLCHEVGHILRHAQLKYEYSTNNEVYNNKELERFCDRFAAAFLMPRIHFLKMWTNVINNVEVLKIAYIAKCFNVSIEACRNRARDLELIN